MSPSAEQAPARHRLVEPQAVCGGCAHMHRQPKPSVILVREWEQQLTGSGCCGKLEGDFLGCRGEEVFAERRAVMERMGPVYRALRSRFGADVDLQVVDPRNASLFFLLLRDFRAYHVGLRAALATLFGLPKQGVIVNGRLIDRTTHPDAERVVAMVEELAALPARQPIRS
jgi:hypothetical protein